MDSQQSDFYGLAILNSFGGKNSNISVWMNFDINYRGFNWSEIKTNNYKTLGGVKEHVFNFVHTSEHTNWNCVAICTAYYLPSLLHFLWNIDILLHKQASRPNILNRSVVLKPQGTARLQWEITLSLTVNTFLGAYLVTVKGLSFVYAARFFSITT